MQGHLCEFQDGQAYTERLCLRKAINQPTRQTTRPQQKAASKHFEVITEQCGIQEWGAGVVECGCGVGWPPTITYTYAAKTTLQSAQARPSPSM